MNLFQSYSFLLIIICQKVLIDMEQGPIIVGLGLGKYVTRGLTHINVRELKIGNFTTCKGINFIKLIGI